MPLLQRLNMCTKIDNIGSNNITKIKNLRKGCWRLILLSLRKIKNYVEDNHIIDMEELTKLNTKKIKSLYIEFS